MKYEPALDGLRALAVCAVFLYHFNDSILPGGWSGVDVFFVLSGFLITSILCRDIDRHGAIDFRCFYRNRFLRLLPAFAILLITMLLRALLSHNTAMRHEMLSSVAISATYLMNLSLAFHWTNDIDGILGHTWSLATEEQFYLLWPLLLIAVFKPSRARLLGLTIICLALWRCYLAVSGSPVDRTYNGLDTHADPLLIGCLLAFFRNNERFVSFCTRTTVAPIATLLIIVLGLPLHSDLTQSIGITVAAMCAAWIVIAATQDGWLKRILSAKAAVYVGRISYGIYLFHYPIVIMAKAHFAPLPAFVVSLSAFPIAAASYHFVEVRFLRLKKKPRSNSAMSKASNQAKPTPNSTLPGIKTQSEK